MTVRNGKRLVLVAGALILVALALEAYLDLTRPGRAVDWFGLMAPALFLVVLWTIWGRYSRMEAENGPGSEVRGSARARPWLVALALAAAVLGGVAGYLIATR